MTFAEIKNFLESLTGHAMAHTDTGIQPCLIIPHNELENYCEYLYKDDHLYFDVLSCITGIDNGPEVGTMEVIYQFYSIPYRHTLMAKVIMPRNKPHEPLPEISSISHLWKSANWLEREVYDLLGIIFTNHPDLRRILMPADWDGHPLRKDYKHTEAYHGIIISS